MSSLHAWYNARCICMLVVAIVLYFGTKFLLRRGELKTRENSNLCGREQCQSEGFTVHMNSDEIFLV